MGYTTIATKLLALLTEITDFAVVYDHDPDSLGSYPAATLQAESHRDSFYDTAANRRSFTFLIRLYYRIDEDQDAESIMRDLADQVLAKLEANVSVPGVWEVARPTQADWTFGERELPVRIVEVRVSIDSRELRAA